MELEKRQPKVSLFWPTWFSPIPMRLRREIREAVEKDAAAKARKKARKSKAK